MEGTNARRIDLAGALIRRNRLTAAAVIVAIVSLVSCSTSPAEDPPADESTTTLPESPTTTAISTTTGPPPSSTTAPEPGPGAEGWTLLPSLGDDTYTDFPIRAVATWPDGLMAAGVAVTDQSGDAAEAQPLVWTSADGTEWTQANLGTRPGEVNDIVWGNDTLIAVGGSGNDAAAWLSADGFEWDQVILPSPERTFARMKSVVAVGEGFYAAGFESSWPDTVDWEETDFDATVWFSTDGLEWERIEHPVFDERGFQEWADGGYSEIIGAAATEWGLVFAGSSSEPGTGYPHNTTVWVLRDGWGRVNLGTDDQIRGVSEAEGVAVVYGSSEASPSADAVFYVSSDGYNWRLAGGHLTGIGAHDGLQFVNDVVYVPGEGWLAVGTDEKDFSTIGGAAVWTAPPGLPLEWTRLAHDAGVFGDLTQNPLETMLGANVWEESVIVVGGQARNVDLGEDGSMCCEYVPSIWVREGVGRR